MQTQNLWCKTCDYDFRKPESEGQNCPLCSKPAKLLGYVSKTLFKKSSQFSAYTCPITDKPIQSERQHRENLAAHGCRVMEKGEAAENSKRKKQIQEAAHKKMDAEVDAVINQLSSDEKELLSQADADVSITRGDAP